MKLTDTKSDMLSMLKDTKGTIFNLEPEIIKVSQRRIINFLNKIIKIKDFLYVSNSTQNTIKRRISELQGKLKTVQTEWKRNKRTDSAKMGKTYRGYNKRIIKI